MNRIVIAEGRVHGERNEERTLVGSAGGWSHECWWTAYCLCGRGDVGVAYEDACRRREAHLTEVEISSRQTIVGRVIRSATLVQWPSLGAGEWWVDVVEHRADVATRVKFAGKALSRRQAEARALASLGRARAMGLTL